MSYPEGVAYDWLIKNDIPFIHQYRTLSYNGEFRFVDFYIPDKNLFVEIDGEYWHKYSSEADSKKDEFALKEYGIKTVRISAKKSIELQLEQIFFS